MKKEKKKILYPTLITTASIYSAVHGAKHTPLPKIIGKRVGQSANFLKGYYKPGAKKSRMFAEHVKSNRLEEIAGFIKENPKEIPKGLSPKKQIAHVEKLMRRWGFETAAELRLDAQKQKISSRFYEKKIQAPYGLSAVKRKIRHERLKNEMVRYVTGQKHSNRNLIADGLSKPVDTDMKSLFKGHEKAGKLWGLHPDLKVSASNITHVGNDKTLLIKAAKKDHMFKMGEFVNKHAKDINNPREVRALAQQRLFTMGTKLRGAQRLHPDVGSIAEELDKFMDRYRVNSKGQLSINFSPGYKPHYLSGGVNADAVFSTGKKGGKHFDLLVSDRYDIGKAGPILKKQHFNVAHSTSRGKAKVATDYGRIAQRSKLLKAVSEGDWKTATKAAGRLGIKLATFLARKGKMKL